ncbi:MAG: hypothetical protein AAFV53_31165 [Myxococcota bacterium]
MRFMIPMFLMGCSTAVTIQSKTPNTTVYVTDYFPSPDTEPAGYVATGEAPLVCEVDYFAWEKFYVWASAPGHTPAVVPVKREIKAGPAVAGFCLTPIFWIWAYGPADDPVFINLKPATADIDNGVYPYIVDSDPMAPAAQDGDQSL